MLQVTPAINCSDFECVKERFDFVLNQLESEWAHFDVSDGEFGNFLNWNKPEEFVKKYSVENDIFIETHLMVKRPEDLLEPWKEMKVKRFIIHLETVLEGDRERKRGNGESALGTIFDFCADNDIELMLASVPGTPIERMTPYLDEFQAFQILSVDPGPSGQRFKRSVLEKIRYIRERMPDVDIEVDGDVNPQTLSMAKEAGANLFVSGSYIFNSEDPGKAYRVLKEEAEKKV